MAAKLPAFLSKENWAREYSGPLYAQLSQYLSHAIRSGVLEEGEALPPEREIARMSNLSRVTVRKAFEELVRDGLVVQRQGSGTSVASNLERVQQSLSRLTSFSEDMKRRGIEAQSVWLEKGVFSPSPQETVALGLAPDKNVVRINRLRIADGNPLAIERASLSEEFVHDPEEIGESLYAYLAKFNNKPSRAVQRISALIINKRDAKLLGIPEGSAGLSLERISYLASGTIVEFTRSIYRGDAYDFVAELRISNDL